MMGFVYLTKVVLSFFYKFDASFECMLVDYGFFVKVKDPVIGTKC